MNNTSWTQKEVDLFAALDDESIVKKTGRTFNAVRAKRNCLKRELPKKERKKLTPPATYEADKVRVDEAHWKRSHDELAKKYSRALKENTVVERLVAEIKDVAPLSYSPAPPAKYKAPARASEPQTALLLFSDTHVGKVVHRAQTLGLAEYGFRTFLARLKYLEESIISIRTGHTTTEIDGLVIAMIGDMLDGGLGHGVEAGQRNTRFAQFYAAGHAIAQFFRNLAPHFKVVDVKTVVGNHTRWDNQKKMPTENRFSNLDMFLYALVEALTRDVKNIRWDLNQQPFQVFQIYDWVFYAAHGDHLRGGDKALGIPNHAFARQISTTTQLFNKHDMAAPNYYLTGHLHREITLPHATGSVMVNGGFPGLDNYALSENFNPVDPTQRFCFIHPKFGKTAEYSLSLKFATDGTYDVPANFPLE